MTPLFWGRGGGGMSVSEERCILWVERRDQSLERAVRFHTPPPLLFALSFHSRTAPSFIFFYTQPFTSGGIYYLPLPFEEKWLRYLIVTRPLCFYTAGLSVASDSTGFTARVINLLRHPLSRRQRLPPV